MEKSSFEMSKQKNTQRDILMTLMKPLSLKITGERDIIKVDICKTFDSYKNFATDNKDDFTSGDKKIYDIQKNIHSENNSKELNNILPPYVLCQIWKIYEGKGPWRDIDDFFDIKLNKLGPDGKYHKFEKVSNIYDTLNTIGYYPDEGMHKKIQRFISAFSDTGHASMASFTNVLFSRDVNFIKKTKAAYKYLSITTVINNPDNRQ